MEAQDSHLFKVTKQIGAQKGSRPIEARSWMLTRKMLETLVHSNSNRNTMFLPKISPEKNKTLVSLPRENKHMFISEPSHFFFFPWIQAQPGKYSCDCVTLMDTLAGWKKVKETENFLTCHIWCAFKAGN